MLLPSLLLSWTEGGTVILLSFDSLLPALTSETTEGFSSGTAAAAAAEVAAAEVAAEVALLLLFAGTGGGLDLLDMISSNSLPYF